MSKTLKEYFNSDELASSVWLGKYAKEGETTPDDMHKRMAKEFARIENNYLKSERETLNLSTYGKARKALTKEKIYNLFKDFKYIIPQGRVMAGLGITESYRSLSNCLRLPPPKDSYSSIMYSDTMLVSAAKRGCGYGLGLSDIRPRTANVSNAASSSTGAASFMDRYSNSTREVAQDGRRGACLEDMSIFHPDVLEFITKKRDRTKVTGANISVKLYDSFMNAVEEDKDFLLRFPCTFDGEDLIAWQQYEYNVLNTEVNSCTGEKIYLKRIKAKEYWEIIIDNAWENAEPGLFYWDRVLAYDPSSVYERYFIDGTNACGEQPMAVYDTCRLILINLYSYVKNPFTDKAEIDYDLLYRMSYEQTRLGDDLVDLEIEYIDRIIEKIMSDEIPLLEKQIELTLWENVKNIARGGRRVGCGVTALADMIAATGHKYDSAEALKIVDRVMKTKMAGELDCTIDLSILRGSFEDWDRNKEFHPSFSGKNDFYKFLSKEFPERAYKMCIYGRRNVNWSTIAPAGSVSLIAKTEDFCNLSSGGEPTFMPYYMRKKKINPSDEDVRVDFVDQSGDSWQEYPIIMGAFKQWYKIYVDNRDSVELHNQTKEQMQKTFEKSPWYNSTANDIDWEKRVEMQSVLQKYTTSAISSTLNLSKDVSREKVSSIYLQGWKKGLKGLTIYRDGCRTGVLTAESSRDQFEYRDSTKRPKEIDGEIVVTSIKGVEYSIFVGLVDSKPYEVFGYKGTTLQGKGTITKRGKGEYYFKRANSDRSDNRILTDKMSDEEKAVTRLISMSLRHGGNVMYIVEQLEKSRSDMFGFTGAIGRILKRFIVDGTRSTLLCQNRDCTGDGTNVIFEEGCSKCLDCGSSKCG